MSDENENGRPGSNPGGRAPITLKPRQGSVSAGVVKQSFSHGRTKTVVVETKRVRPHAPPAGNLAAPSSAERRQGEAPRPQSQGGGQGGSAGGLSQSEMVARQRAIEAAREQQERQAAERRAAEARAAAAEAAAREAAAKAAAAVAAQGQKK